MTESKTHWKTQILLFFISQCVTLFGSQLVQMAIVWYATLYTGSGAWVAAFSLCAYLPQFFVSFAGGVLADRRCKKRLILGADALIAAVTGGMLMMMPYIPAGRALLAALLLMSLIRSAGAGIQTPAVNAVIAQLVPAPHRMRYNGINAAMQSAVQFAAPAAAAVVLSRCSLRWTLAIDVFTAVIGIALCACVRFPEQKASEQTPSVFADMKLGVRYAYTHRSIRRLLMLYGFFLFFTVPAGYLSGLLVSRIYGDTYWHLTAAELAGFGGMAAGGLLMSLQNGLKSQRRTLALSLALFGAVAIAMSTGLAFSQYLVLMALYGVALTAVQTTITTMLQSKTASAMQGRVFGLMSALYASCYPLGMALFGPLADHLPLQWMMIFSGIALMTAAAIAYTAPPASTQEM